MDPREQSLILGMALVTFLIRYPLLAMSDRIQLSPQLLQALNYLPPAVLTAIAVPAVLVENNSLWIGLDNPRLIGAIAALITGFWRQNLLLTITVGLATFLGWQQLV